LPRCYSLTGPTAVAGATDFAADTPKPRMRVSEALAGNAMEERERWSRVCVVGFGAGMVVYSRSISNRRRLWLAWSQRPGLPSREFGARDVAASLGASFYLVIGISGGPAVRPSIMPSAMLSALIADQPALSMRAVAIAALAFPAV
jgi:hypothetical protein